ncbi:MAG: pyrimidine reductase family protein [Micromonosporaceae bacterium]|jgi:riboflavin biosynthesis pyrimidine reductase|nr:pyrimidine reductase family protein [Micromonosporaceae bacterium]
MVHRLWPDPCPLDDEALTAAYAVSDRAGTHLRMNFVTSVDGAVEVGGFSAGLFSHGLPRDADLKVFGLLRMLCDALLVGAGTLRHEGYQALRLDRARRSWRRAHGLAEYPTLVVVSSALDLMASNPALAEAPVRPIVLTHAAAPADRRAALEPVADVLTLGDGAVDLAAGVERLAERGLRHLLSEGGPHLFGALSAAGLVDEVDLTVSPLLAGPGADRIIAGAGHPPARFALRHILADDHGTLLLRYTRP